MKKKMTVGMESALLRYELSLLSREEVENMEKTNKENVSNDKKCKWEKVECKENNRRKND